MSTTATTASTTAAAKSPAILALEASTDFQNLGGSIQHLLRLVVQAEDGYARGLETEQLKLKETSSSTKNNAAASTSAVVSDAQIKQLTKVSVRLLAKVYDMLRLEEDPRTIFRWVLSEGNIVRPVSIESSTVKPARNSYGGDKNPSPRELIRQYQKIERQQVELNDAVKQAEADRKTLQAANAAERKQRHRAAQAVYLADHTTSTPNAAASPSSATTHVDPMTSSGVTATTTESSSNKMTTRVPPSAQDVADIVGVFTGFVTTVSEADTSETTGGSGSEFSQWWKQGDVYRRDYERHGYKGKLWTSMGQPANPTTIAAAATTTTASSAEGSTLRAPQSELENREAWYKSQCWWKRESMKRDYLATKDTAWWKEERYIRDWQDHGKLVKGENAGEEEQETWTGGSMWLAVDEHRGSCRKGDRYPASSAELHRRVQWYHNNGPKGIVKAWCGALDEKDTASTSTDRCSLLEKSERVDYYENNDWWRTDEVAFGLPVSSQISEEQEAEAQVVVTLPSSTSASLFAPGSNALDTEWWMGDKYRQEFFLAKENTTNTSPDYTIATYKQAFPGSDAAAHGSELARREAWYTANWWKAPAFIADYLQGGQGGSTPGGEFSTAAAGSWKSKKKPVEGGADQGSSKMKKQKKCRESEALRRVQWYKSHLAELGLGGNSESPSSAATTAGDGDGLLGQHTSVWWKLGDLYLRDFQQNGDNGKLWTAASDPTTTAAATSTQLEAGTVLPRSPEVELAERRDYFTKYWWKAEAYVREFQKETATAGAAGDTQQGGAPRRWKATQRDVESDVEWWKRPEYIQHWRVVTNSNNNGSNSAVKSSGTHPAYLALFETDASASASAASTSSSNPAAVPTIPVKESCGALDAELREAWFRKNWWKSPEVLAEYRAAGGRSKATLLMNHLNPPSTSTGESIEHCSTQELQERSQYFDLLDHPPFPEPASFLEVDARKRWYQCQLTEQQKMARRSWLQQHIDGPKIRLDELPELGKALNDGQEVDPATLAAMNEALRCGPGGGSPDGASERLVSVADLLLAMTTVRCSATASTSSPEDEAAAPFFIPWTPSERLRVNLEQYQQVIVDNAALRLEEAAYKAMEADEEGMADPEAALAAYDAADAEEDAFAAQVKAQEEDNSDHDVEEEGSEAQTCGDDAEAEQLWQQWSEEQLAIEAARIEQQQDQCWGEGGEGEAYDGDMSSNAGEPAYHDQSASDEAPPGQDVDADGGSDASDDEGDQEGPSTSEFIGTLGNGEVEQLLMMVSSKDGGPRSTEYPAADGCGSSVPDDVDDLTVCYTGVYQTTDGADDDEEEEEDYIDYSGGADDEEPQMTSEGNEGDTGSRLQQWKLPLSQVSNPQFLKSYFTVLKNHGNGSSSGAGGGAFFGKLLGGSAPAKRVWVVDHFTRSFYNLDRHGKIKKEHAANKLLQLERHLMDSCKLRLMFYGTDHSYELEFLSAMERERFFETAQAIRPSVRVFAPWLTNPDPTVDATTTTIDGVGKEAITVEVPTLGKKTVTTVATAPATRELSGECKINASKLPTEPIKVWTGTFNLSGRKPPPTDKQLGRWIPKPSSNNTSTAAAAAPAAAVSDYDIYAVVVQEASYRQDENEWLDRLKHFLGPNYTSLATMTLWDTQLSVHCKKKHLLKVTNVEGSTKATAHKSVCGTKGGLGISLKYLETSMCFVGCHLAARLERTLMRNTNLAEIFEGLQLGNSTTPVDGGQFDHVFLMGDLNYRLEGLDLQEAMTMIRSQDYSSLLRYDQLTQEQSTGDDDGGLLHKFREAAPICFPPTFRMDVSEKVGTESRSAVPAAPCGTYNPERGQPPSYCDRVLTASNYDGSLKCLSYTSHPDVQCGEHMPVSATFLLRCLRPTMHCFSPMLASFLSHPQQQQQQSILVIDEVHFEPSSSVASRVFLKKPALLLQGQSPSLAGGWGNQAPPTLPTAPTGSGASSPGATITWTSKKLAATSCLPSAGSAAKVDPTLLLPTLTLLGPSAATAATGGVVLLVLHEMAEKRADFRHRATGALRIPLHDHRFVEEQELKKTSVLTRSFSADAVCSGQCVGKFTGTYHFAK